MVFYYYFSDQKSESVILCRAICYLSNYYTFNFILASIDENLTDNYDSINKRTDTKDTEIHNVYIEYINQYKDVEYKNFEDSLNITVGIGEVAGLSNITGIFSDSYFRD